MIKRRLCAIVLTSMLLTGCQSTDLTKSESGQIAEYIAYSLLKYNDSPEMLVTKTEAADKSKEPIEVSKEPVEQEKLDSNTAQTSSPASSADVKADKESISAGTLFGSSDFQLSVRKKGLYQSYPKNSSSTYFSLTAQSGKKLLVLDVTVKNSGSSKRTFKTADAGLEYSLNGNSAKALVTLLKNDIHFIKQEIKSGAKSKAIIVFEVDKNIKMDNLKLTVTKDGQSVDISVK